MKTVDLTPLIENDQTFSKLSSDIRESYECNWDDPVHDSYRRFVQEATDGAAKLHEIQSAGKVTDLLAACWASAEAMIHLHRHRLPVAPCRMLLSMFQVPQILWAASWVLGKK